MAGMVNELKTICAIKSRTRQAAVTAVSTKAGSTAQARGQGLRTISGSALSTNVSNISDINKFLSSQQECEKFIDRSVKGKNSRRTVSVDKKEALKAIKSNTKCKCEKSVKFFGKSVNGKYSNAKPVQKAEKKVDAAEVRHLEAGNLAHCFSLIKDDKT